MVACRNIDGSYHVCGGHSAGGYRSRGKERNCRQLAVVEFCDERMLTVFLYARLWRRAGVMTDIEFAEMRYSGKAAAFLRGFRALYLGLPINRIIMGWVNLAMVKILETTRSSVKSRF